MAERLTQEAARLRERFDAAFWNEEIGTYALALDGAKKQCAVRSSNAGHALFTGIAKPERAARVAETLLCKDGFNGWGVRTIAKGEARYNPMSYHNGSIWPHDNALIAHGPRRATTASTRPRASSRGCSTPRSTRTSSGCRSCSAASCAGTQRGPVSYPVACSPQAWAAAAPFAFLAACLGLELDHDRNRVRLKNPILPSFLDGVTLYNVRLGALAPGHPLPALRRRRHRLGAAPPRRRAGGGHQVGHRAGLRAAARFGLSGPCGASRRRGRVHAG